MTIEANATSADERMAAKPGLEGIVAPEIVAPEIDDQSVSAIKISKGKAKGSDVAGRLCVVTRESMPRQGLLRFVIGPDGQLVPDLKEKLPGRGAWVTNSREIIARAVAKNLFAKSFRQPVQIDPALLEQIEFLLETDIFNRLAFANKAGLVITGSNKIIEAIAKDKVILIIHASEAAADGRQRIADAAWAANRAAGMARERDGQYGAIAVYDRISGEDLDRVFGKGNITHVALKKDIMAKFVFAGIDRLLAFLAMEPLLSDAQSSGGSVSEDATHEIREAPPPA